MYNVWDYLHVQIPGALIKQKGLHVSVSLPHQCYYILCCALVLFAKTHVETILCSFSGDTHTTAKCSKRVTNNGGTKKQIGCKYSSKKTVASSHEEQMHAWRKVVNAIEVEEISELELISKQKVVSNVRDGNCFRHPQLSPRNIAITELYKSKTCASSMQNFTLARFF